MFAGSDYFRHLTATNDDATEINIGDQPLANKEADCKRMVPAKKSEHRKGQYTKAQLQLAYEAVQSGISLYRACRMYGIPRTTLEYRVKKQLNDLEVRSGPKSYLSKSQELSIVSSLHSLADAGFTLTNGLIQIFASEYVNANIEQFPAGNPFPAGKASNSWATHFWKKHSDLEDRLTCSGKGSISQERVHEWFRFVTAYLEKMDLQTVIQNHRQVFTLDEVDLTKGKNELKFVCLFGANARGTLLPPLVVYPEVIKIPSQKKQSKLKYAVAQQDTETNAGNALYQWLSRVFHPWLVEENVPLPVILFVDGHRHQMGYLSSQFCQQHQIVLVSLLPRNDHMLRPLNVKLFGLMKKLWHEKLKSLGKGNFTSMDALLEPVLSKLTDTENIIRDGFCQSGLCPWIPEGHDAQPQTRSTADPALDLFRRILDSRLSEQLLADFEAHRHDEVWTGAVEHTSLFRVWRDLQNEIDAGEPEMKSSREKGESGLETKSVTIKQEETGDCSLDFVKEEPICDYEDV